MDQKNPRRREDIQLPPGFRFHPSDEELIVHYLRKKATKAPLPASVVAEVELYKFNPWDLPKKSVFGDEEWYFFTPRDRKYPNGTRPNRMAVSGYWKATGIDKPILTSCGSKVVGVKKALVFYTGRPPKGNKTEWIMHEYRLPEPHAPWSAKKEKSMRLDEWVLCRVRQKTSIPFGNLWEDRNGPSKCWSTDNTMSITTPNLEMLPFLFGASNAATCQEFAMDAVSSSISFEGGNKCSGTTASSVSEDDFNIEYLQSSAASNLGMQSKRKLLFDEAAENFMTRPPQPNKKATCIEGELPINDNVLDNYSAMIASRNTTTNQSSAHQNTNVVHNNNVDHLGPPMMYQDLYSLAFA